jgi:hypothetical protein
MVSGLRCRPIALFLLVVFLGGCVTWRPTTVSPRQVIEEEQPSRIRVTHMSGEITVVSDPGVVNDSIVFLQEPCPAGVVAVEGRPCGPVVALADVRTLEVRQVSATRTIALYTLPLLAMIGLLKLGVGDP